MKTIPSFFSQPRALRRCVHLRAIALLVVCAGFAGCAVNPNGADSAKAVAQPHLQFVDLQGFDRDLAASLAAPLPSVDISFYDRVIPSALPERLQKWMASVEAGGGSVKIVPPAPTVTAKSPLLLVSLASSLWTASKMAKEASAAAQVRAAHAYNAEVQLKVDDKGDTVVDKVVFSQRKK